MKAKLLGAASAWLLAGLAVFGQATTSISGSITDATGAAIPRASVELLNTETNQSRESTATDEGAYTFAQVQPGTYRLTVKAAGFNTLSLENLRLLVGNPVTQNAQLEIGKITNTVAVNAESAQINTVDSSLGNAFGTKPIMQLPLEGRNVVGLLSLQPGVSYVGSNENFQGNGTTIASYRTGNVNGGKSDQANVTLDGVDVNDQQNRDPFTSVLRTTLDSTQEFRVVTTGAGADLGRSSGAQVTLVTKSGTNELHGSAYEYLRNKATNANSFFNNTNGVPLAKLNRNVYGASLGGPLKKNRLFLFGNYEGRKDRREDSTLRTVPTATLRQGIVSYVRTNGSVAQLSPNDLRTRIDPRGIGPNAAALAVMNRYPIPNDTSIGDGINTSGYRFNAPITLNWQTYIAKLDYALDSQGRHQLFVRGNLQDDNQSAAAQFPGLPPNNVILGNTKGLAVGLTSSLSERSVNNFRYGITRVGLENTGVSRDAFVTFRGIDSILGTNRPFIRKTPVHTFANDFSTIKGNHDLRFGGVVRLIRNNRLNFANSFPTANTNSSWLTGSGSGLNAGLTDLAATGRTAYRDAATAVLGLVTQGTANYNYNKDGSALPVGTGVGRQFNAEEYEMYAQDTWRVNKELTVTYGLRWSLMPPIYEANGVQTVAQQSLSDFFDTRVALAGAGLSQDRVTPVAYVLSDQPGGRSLYPFHKKNFAPRFALAYSPKADDPVGRVLFGGPGKTAIRAGWGMFYDVMGSGLITNYDASALGLSTSLSNPSNVLTVASSPRYTGLNNIPSGILPAAPPSGFPATAPNVFAITNSLDDRLKPPYTMNMNLSIARSFDRGFFVQLSYVGRLSRRSLASEDIAAPTNLRDPNSGQTYFQAASQMAGLASANTPTAAVPRIPFFENFYGNLAGGGLSATQQVYDQFSQNAPDYTSALYNLDVNCDPDCSRLGPYAFFNRQYSYLRTLRSVGNGNYHAFQFSTRKQFSNGDQIDFNYTWSKAIDLTSTPEAADGNFTQGVIINPYNRGLARAPADYDTRQQWNANVVYNLPFGSGRKFLDRKGFVNALVGGWQLTALYRQSTGLPNSVGNGRFWPTNWNITGNATVIGPVADGTNRNAPAPPGGSTGVNIFQDPAAAVRSFDYTFPGGVGSRNIIRGDGNLGLDMGLGKSFLMPWASEHPQHLQLRWEVFNVTNTTRFDPLQLSANLGSIGSFGRYTDTLTTPRVMQFAARYDF